MKKFFAAILCAVMLLSTCAHAEVAYDAWVLDVTDITITQGEHTILLTPTIAVHVGTDEDCNHGWIQLEAPLNGEAPMAFQMEYDKGVLRFSAIGAQDCLVMEEGDHMTILYSMMWGLDPGIDAKTAFSGLRSLLESPEAAEQLLTSISGEGFAVEPLGAGVYGIHIALDGWDIRCKLQWARGNGIKPFDFSGKNIVQYRARYGFTGGNDIANALETGMMQLMADETVAQMMALFGVQK